MVKILAATYRNQDKYNTDTHISMDNRLVLVNSEYKTEAFVNISCNKFCCYDVKQYNPMCEVKAILSLPEHDNSAYMYNKEAVVPVSNISTRCMQIWNK